MTEAGMCKFLLTLEYLLLYLDFNCLLLRLKFELFLVSIEAVAAGKLSQALFVAVAASLTISMGAVLSAVGLMVAAAVLV